jgi:hypothetical protein
MELGHRPLSPSKRHHSRSLPTASKGWELTYGMFHSDIYYAFLTSDRQRLLILSTQVALKVLGNFNSVAALSTCPKV